MEKKKSLKVAGDLVYTIMATVVMNVALQIIIYPLVTRFYGDEVTGTILYFIGFIYIIPQALGSSLSNARLVTRKTSDVTNADFNRIIVITSALSAVSCGAIGFIDKFDLAFAILYGLFSIIYMLRMYAQVDFRLNLKFKEYFIYYCIISVGYLLGFGLFMLTDVWLFIFIVGEGLALAYSFIFGTIFKKDSLSGHRGQINKVIVMMILSTLMRDAVIQFDKVILKSISANVVTQYHVVSLIAKTMQMLVHPINTLILSYLTVKDAVLSRKTLTKFIVASLLFGTVFYGVCVVGTPIYIRLFYPSLYDTVIQYNFIVNLGLILGFIATMFMALLLSQQKTAIYTAIECVYGVVYIVAAYFFISMYQIWGLAIITTIMNILKLLVVLVCLIITCKPKKEIQQ